MKQSSTGEPGRVQRRRGAALEEAILEAAWDELVTGGFAALTMESVAARAKASKPVLYRRWRTRTELVVAAVREHTQSSAIEVPDTGDLRDDVLALLRDFSRRSAEFVGMLSFFMVDYRRETGEPPAVLRERVLAGGRSRMRAVLQRAVERGEIDPAVLETRIADLPVDLVRHDLIMAQKPVSEDGLREIVDEIFLPLVKRRAPQAPESHGGV